MGTTGTGQHLCPSAPARDGAVLLGVVGPHGAIGYVQPLVQIDAEFVERASRAGAPEARFRFASPCLESGCGYWTGHSCGVIEQVLARHEAGDIPATDELPHCMIRGSCRWYSQAGRDACAVCPYVVTKVERGSGKVREARIPASAVPTLTG